VVISNYAALVHASCEDALAGTRALVDSVDAFLEAPGADSLSRAASPGSTRASLVDGSR